jgi:hypothetical protein
VGAALEVPSAGHDARSRAIKHLRPLESPRPSHFRGGTHQSVDRNRNPARERDRGKDESRGSGRTAMCDARVASSGHNQGHGVPVTATERGVAARGRPGRPGALDPLGVLVSERARLGWRAQSCARKDIRRERFWRKRSRSRIRHSSGSPAWLLAVRLVAVRAFPPVLAQAPQCERRTAREDCRQQRPSPGLRLPENPLEMPACAVLRRISREVDLVAHEV